MSAVRGGFSIPTPQKTTQLSNDAQFMSVKEYALTPTTLHGSTTYTIRDIPAGSVVHQVDLLVNTAFVSSASQNNLAVQGSDNTVLMASTWNDPNTAGNYTTKCNYTVTSTLKVTHDLNAATAGNATLRIYLHTL